LAYETKSLLIGEPAEPEIVAGIQAIIDEESGVRKTNEILTLHMGPEFILANISIEFANGQITGEIESLISNISRKIRAKYPIVKRVFIEAEDHAPNID
jgi:divalent metal cation (Fe/Co/Zn/Cd) transporter